MAAVTISKNDERTVDEVFSNLAISVDDFEGYDNPHASRVASIAEGMARILHLGRHDRFSLRIAALAHDLGEMAMGRDYINRTGPLSAEERMDLARHPL